MLGATKPLPEPMLTRPISPYGATRLQWVETHIKEGVCKLLEGLDPNKESGLLHTPW